MRVILRTRCGLTREIEIPRLERMWRVPLMEDETRFCLASPLDDPVRAIQVRDFEYRGKQIEGKPVYEERRESAAIEPRADALVPLTGGEWADAVARCRTRAMMDDDHDFLRRHDGAEIVTHKTGALIGAFYIAPSWSIANDFARLLAQLRALLNREDWT